MPDHRPATERLVEALLAAGLDRMDPMARRAEDGEYDDFKSRRFELPIHALVAHARVRGLHDIVQRAIAGEFDAAPWESEQWANSPEGRATMRSVLGDNDAG